MKSFKKIFFLLLFFGFYGFGNLFSQTWVDTSFAYQIFPDVVFGIATDFAGNSDTLKMDICVPVGDNPPQCGRPLMVTVHGGAFLSGDKNDFLPRQAMIDFAKRGYVTASVNYRLGMFNTSANWHCNVTYFGLPFDCLNMADSLEWHRAYFRAIQDVKGSIRYLISRKTDFNIDPQNVFIVGESAGGFISMGVAFMDSSAEKPAAAFAQSNVNAPNAIYEAPCIQNFNWAPGIAGMNFTRPDLGSVDGSLYLADSNEYRLAGVGSFYGGTFSDLFGFSAGPELPVLYMFHQPNDLIVSKDYKILMIGYSYCLVTNFGCAYPLNMPHSYGSSAVKDLVDSHSLLGDVVPVYVYDSTTNNAPCLQQASNPATTGHQVDNYWSRTVNMAQIFAAEISCNPGHSEDEWLEDLLELFPSPANNSVSVQWKGKQINYADLVDISGKSVCRFHELEQITGPGRLTLPLELMPGLYFLRIFSGERQVTGKILIAD